MNMFTAEDGWPVGVTKKGWLANEFDAAAATHEFTYRESELALGVEGLRVRPLLMAGGKQVGAAGMAVGAELDRTTETVMLEPNKPVTVAFRLSDESPASLRVVVQDPATDAELYRSPTDIPVRLGI